jgi:hypothetical protein
MNAWVEEAEEVMCAVLSQTEARSLVDGGTFREASVYLRDTLQPPGLWPRKRGIGG